MRFLSNAHTHTSYCDGKNTPREMVQAAREFGFVSLGFSGHGMQGFDTPYAMEDGRQGEYVAEIRVLQAEINEQKEFPRIWVGVEQDTLVPKDIKEKNRQDFDYIIGSTHYLCRDYKGEHVAVDGNLEPLKAYVKDVYAGDMLAMARAYFDVHVQMLLAERPDIIGHFDLVRKHARMQSLFDEESAAYQKIALHALEEAFACGGVMEVNTGGMQRGFIKNPYPSEALLPAWREMGGDVTITSDCHDAAFLNYGLDEALALLKKMGYSSVLRLGQGDSLWERVEC